MYVSYLGYAMYYPPWASLFAGNRKPEAGHQLKVIEPKSDDLDDIIFEEKHADNIEDSWGFCLVGCFAGRFPGKIALLEMSTGSTCGFWNPDALSMVATKIGKPLHMDSLIVSKERISFPRMLVEVDASKELTRELRIRLPSGKRRMQQVLYEHEPKFCTKCKEIGHSTQGCTKKNKAADRQPFKPRVRKPVAQNQPTRQTLKAPEPARVANNVQQTQPIKDKEPVEIIEEAQVQPSKEKQPVQTESESQPFTEVRGRRPRKRITPVPISEDTKGHASLKPLWDNLISFGENCSLPWIAIGDFNNVLNANEKCNGKDVTSKELKHFEECCVLTGLTDLRSMGCHFTWTNNEVWCKLDRAMVNKHWFDQGLNGMANFLPSGCLSDHSLVLSLCWM
ncbi:hypothetical protein DH2020_020364 [Rehmannia glutinosa]|uniref:DUF4283 domain-containing protein n=1 Tax=Rehmannia glutinosa TaxID=99300 RepID=A0ABR0WH61_REHGL